MKIYVSGPMTGLPDHNYPMFYKVSDALRNMGHEVLNPAELDESVVPGSQPWEWYLRRDLKAMLDYDVLVMLPGWQNSKGATLERYVASILKMPIYIVDVNTFDLTEDLEYV